MKKIDEIYKFINENAEYRKETIIKKVVKRFEVSPASAQAYYYKWKKAFMKGANCVPKNPKSDLQLEKKEEPKKEKLIEVTNNDLKIEQAAVIKGKYGLYIKEGKKVIAGDEVFRSIEDLEAYKKKEVALFYARLSEIYDIFELDIL